MPFGKCHAFGLPLVDSSQFVNWVWIPLTFTEHFNKGQLHMWARCWGTCMWDEWSLVIAVPILTWWCLSSESGWPSGVTSKRHFHGGATEESHKLERDSERLCLLLEVQCDIRLGWKVWTQSFPITKDTSIWLALKCHLRHYLVSR